MDPGHFRVFFSQCALDERAVVLSFLDPDVDAGAAGTGHGRLVGDRVDGGVDVGCHLRLCLVCRAPVSLRRLDVRAASWPGTPAETGTDELTNRVSVSQPHPVVQKYPLVQEQELAGFLVLLLYPPSSATIAGG